MNSSYHPLGTSYTETLNFNHKIANGLKTIEPGFDIRDFFFKNLQKLTPIFVFYIYKVDKKIFKNTRGKSGKYTFI